MGLSTLQPNVAYCCDIATVARRADCDESGSTEMEVFEGAATSDPANRPAEKGWVAFLVGALEGLALLIAYECGNLAILSVY